ncbi:MAG: UDP-N-acetylmuramoyl-tripeptide--D-alanyl-D-alanine ligase [Porphyromonadaceae bacterium]|nr:UDP-N-acetylmuramoyl-tripeptide--D-alanyl-D-alanine ligase [Porphyromonadaceae bacterium]
MTTLEELYHIYKEHPRVCTDSRNVKQGCIFFALRGERFDGNKYAQMALEAGAAYAVVDDPNLGEQEKMLLVKDVLRTLQELATYHREQLGIPILAITGTNGKTTTKELCASVLARAYRVLYTEGNLNNHIGVPLTLLRLTNEHQLAIIEAGASKRGDIAELCAIARPNYGLITNIGIAHLEGFGSREQIAHTKGELYDWLRAHEGKAFVWSDSEELSIMSSGIPRVDYAFEGDAVVRGTMMQGYEYAPYLCISWQAGCIGVEEHQQRTQLVGQYNAPNVLAAVAVGLFFDVPPEEIQRALEAYIPTNNRSQLIKSVHNRIVADAYNANPVSMRQALESFAHLTGGKPGLLILGSMRELGLESTALHREISVFVSKCCPNYTVYYCGAEWDGVVEGEHVIHFADIDALRAHLEHTPPRGLDILVKGSNSVGLTSILSLL